MSRELLRTWWRDVGGRQIILSRQVGQRENMACNDDGVDVSVGVDDDAVVSPRLVDPIGRALLVNVPFF